METTRSDYVSLFEKSDNPNKEGLCGMWEVNIVSAVMIIIALETIRWIWTVFCNILNRKGIIYNELLYSNEMVCKCRIFCSF